MAADSAPQEAAPAVFAAPPAAEGGQLQGITTVRPRSAGSRGTREQQPVAQLLRGARLGRGRKLRPAGAGLRRASAPAPSLHAPPTQPASLLPPTPQTPRRSKVLKIWSWGAPHHRAFQLSWLSFMLAFFASFAAPPMLPTIR